MTSKKHLRKRIDDPEDVTCDLIGQVMALTARLDAHADAHTKAEVLADLRERLAASAARCNGNGHKSAPFVTHVEHDAPAPVDVPALMEQHGIEIYRHIGAHDPDGEWFPVIDERVTGKYYRTPGAAFEAAMAEIKRSEQPAPVAFTTAPDCSAPACECGHTKAAHECDPSHPGECVECHCEEYRPSHACRCGHAQGDHDQAGCCAPGCTCSYFARLVPTTAADAARTAHTHAATEARAVPSEWQRGFEPDHETDPDYDEEIEDDGEADNA